MRVKWVGGPLDGLVDERPSWEMFWIGPDPADPEEKVVVYLLNSDHTYRWSDPVTKEANRRLREQR